MRPDKIGIAGLLMAAGAAGCSDARTESAGPIRLAPSPAPYFRDVPLPSGFRLLEEQSLSVESGHVRMVSHVYEGRSDAVAVRNFYSEQMPIGKWREVNRSLRDGYWTLHFEKELEGCTVRCGPKSALSGKTVVQVTVTPRKQVEPPPNVSRRQ